MLAAREKEALEGQQDPKRSPCVTHGVHTGCGDSDSLLNAEMMYLGVFYPVI